MPEQLVKFKELQDPSDDGTSQTRLKTVESHMKNQLQQHQGNLTMHWHVQISRQSSLHMASGFGSSQQASDNGSKGSNSHASARACNPGGGSTPASCKASKQPRHGISKLPA
ncbi:hypothetical protein WJX82_000290 [Trebouxia sp. C0006]